MMISCEIVSPSKVRTSQKKIANELGQSNPPPHYHSNRYLTTAETAQERYGKTRRREFVSCMKKTSPTLPAKFQCRPKGVFDRTSRWLLSHLDLTPKLHHDHTSSNFLEAVDQRATTFELSISQKQLNSEEWIKTSLRWIDIRPSRDTRNDYRSLPTDGHALLSLTRQQPLVSPEALLDSQSQSSSTRKMMMVMEQWRELLQREKIMSISTGPRTVRCSPLYLPTVADQSTLFSEHEATARFRYEPTLVLQLFRKLSLSFD